MDMRVFISSVRRGLEEERDALAAIIRAVGHTPIMFEDFSAQSEPSREACLRGVAEADVYLLLLGPSYGHVFPDTGNSPTHEEWTAATAAGLTRIVYRKSGVQFEPEQQRLAQNISDYTAGVFRDAFENTPELLAKVAAKLREIEASDGALTFQLLPSVPTIEWREDFEGRQGGGVSGSQIEVHVIPQPVTLYSSRVMNQIGDSLVDRIRATRLIDSRTSIDDNRNDSAAIVRIPTTRPRSWDESRNGEVVGIRLAKSGQISVWSTLPADGMGSIIDPRVFPDQIAQMLRLVGVLNIVETETIAVGAGISPIGTLTVDTFEQGRSRNRAIGIKTSDRGVRHIPDESVSTVALGAGAAEVARNVARALTDEFNALR